MHGKGEKKFTKADVHRVYFVRTLLEYASQPLNFLHRGTGFVIIVSRWLEIDQGLTSCNLPAQAMDIAGLSKVTPQTIILLLSVFSFMVSNPGSLYSGSC
jgi:hypothetical protein